MKLDYPQKGNGMYIMQKSDFDQLATAVLKEYSPENLVAVKPFDVDYFIKECLYLELVPKYMSHDGSVLGMVTFADTEWKPICGFESKTEIIAEGTICIDPGLMCLKHLGRCRFTKAHECSHWILHRSYHSPNHKAFSFRTSGVSLLVCRYDTIERLSRKPDRPWSTHDWEEWQAIVNDKRDFT